MVSDDDQQKYLSLMGSALSGITELFGDLRVRDIYFNVQFRNRKALEQAHAEAIVVKGGLVLPDVPYLGDDSQKRAIYHEVAHYYFLAKLSFNSGTTKKLDKKTVVDISRFFTVRQKRLDELSHSLFVDPLFISYLELTIGEAYARLCDNLLLGQDKPANKKILESFISDISSGIALDRTSVYSFYKKNSGSVAGLDKVSGFMSNLGYIFGRELFDRISLYDAPDKDKAISLVDNSWCDYDISKISLEDYNPVSRMLHVYTNL